MKTFLKIVLVPLFALMAVACEQTDILGNVSAVIDGTSKQTFTASGVLSRTNQNGGSKNMTINAFFTDDRETLAISVTNNVDGGSGRDFSTGLYTQNSADTKATLILLKDSEEYKSLDDCKIEITNNDSDDRFIDGTFSGTLVNASGDTIKVEKGTFEDVSYR
ncbi:MAG: hypothetical protein MRZ79_00210 [Bacteroidia bacterium]|nr:hypothetical protein [Bacteroidia bacterium]